MPRLVHLLAVLAAVALGATLLPRWSTAKTAARRPDVVVFVADDLGASDLGYAHNVGGPRAFATPIIDALAQKSLKLTRFYGAPMCTPARAALMTGRHPHKTGLAFFVLLANQPTGLDARETTLGERFRARGYATAMIGKWHLGFARRSWLPSNRGFDSFFGYCLGAQDYTRHESGEWLEGSISLGRRRALALDTAGHDLWRNDVPLDRSRETDGVHSADLFASEARTVIGAADRERPLFLYYAAQTPHAHFVGAPARHVAAAQRMGFDGSDARSDVAALVAALDEQVSAVVGAFEARERPLVFWFLGDNGPEAGTGASAFPLRGAKRTCYEGGIRTPSFVYAPGIVMPGATNAVTRIVDVGPTLLGLLGTTVRGLDGRDMRRKWEQSTDSNDDLVLFYDNAAKCGAAVRSHFKYVLNGGCLYADEQHVGWPDEDDDGDPTCVGPGAECLFDLESDPAERVHVGDSHPAVLTALRELIARAERDSAPSRVLETPGDPRADPRLHGGRWVSWLDL